MKLFRQASVVSLCTLLSRVLGMVRDILCAQALGAGDVMGAFVIAFRIPNLFRRLFGEGALASAFVPTFTDYLQNKERAEAWRMAMAVAVALATLLAGIVAILELAVYGLDTFAVSGEGPDAENTRLMLRLTSILLPYLMFICLTALAAAMANALQSFAIPALSPVVLNVFWIGALVLAMRLDFTAPATARLMAWAITLSSVAQLAMQLPQLVRRGMKLSFVWDWAHPGLRHIAKLMAPVILGVATFQINLLVDSLLARYLVDFDAPAILYYSDRLVQLPMALFGIALSTVLFVTLSQRAAAGDTEGFRATLFQGLRGVLVITVPAAVGLAALRTPIIGAIFGGGKFGENEVARAGLALLCYAPGVWIFSCQHIVLRAFYSMHDTRTPVRVSMIMVALNFALNVAFVLGSGWVWGDPSEAGLALATTVAGAVQIVVLLAILLRRIGADGFARVVATLIKTTVAAAVMGLAVYYAALWIGGVLPEGLSTRAGLAAQVAGGMVAGGSVYGIVLYLLAPADIRSLWRQVRRKGGE